ncbi:acylphosphatase [Sulfurihydrogenibium azorense Az-Fu1]|jgi:acylphosphatase|uniref:acylphosphatase n=1 Tax=Sulfurihydrogenibium azorense (strain DSM 15241 / OCM 825 / Az-Fu1) TaxID=204536 RepID=C1DVB2_SULAA|nr:acylphosphatase [Sulfurihydrogenibium azorense]ACN99424.1 acylphosphatase [Sulfurihydrogenibium azorense Az-Fu1]
MQLHIIFAGRVQGVGFRKFVKKVANQMNVRGFVRNLPDGTVEVLAEADEETLKNFFQAIENGPPLASVNGIRYEFLEKEGGFDEFKIEY